MNPEYAIRWRGGSDGVWDGVIRVRPGFGDGRWSEFFRQIYLYFEVNRPIKYIFVGNVRVWGAVFIIDSFFFVEGCVQNPSNEGTGALVGLGDLDSVGRPDASGNLLDVCKCNGWVFRPRNVREGVDVDTAKFHGGGGSNVCVIGGGMG